MLCRRVSLKTGPLYTCCTWFSHTPEKFTLLTEWLEHCCSAGELIVPVTSNMEQTEIWLVILSLSNFCALAALWNCAPNHRLLPWLNLFLYITPDNPRGGISNIAVHETGLVITRISHIKCASTWLNIFLHSLRRTCPPCWWELGLLLLKTRVSDGEMLLLAPTWLSRLSL